MWPGQGCVIGGDASSPANTRDTYTSYFGRVANVPTTGFASGVWNPDQAAYYLNQSFRGLQWPTIKDPHFAQVQFILHLSEHGNGGNLRMMPPFSGLAHDDALEVTTAGGAVTAIQQTTRKFTRYSFNSSGTGSYVSHSINNALIAGTGDITAEGWIYIISANASNGIWDFRPRISGGSGPFLNMVTGKLGFGFSSAQQITGVTTITLNTWHHVAWCKDTGAGKSYIYLDGVSEGNVADANNYGNMANCTIGNNFNSSNNLPGFWQEFRFTAPFARYPGGTSFTPPIAPFPDY
jgi:hypothetical protein